MIRLLAWRWQPEKHDGRVVWSDVCPCEEVCGDGAGGLDDDARARQRCARYDLDPVEWHRDTSECHTCWMGLPPDARARERGEPMWHRPPEPPDEGCVASWYLSVFALSLVPYLPTVSQSGWSHSPRLHHDPHPLVLDAVQLYQREHARCLALELEVRDG